MAKGVYVGINEVTKKVKKIYVGINGVTKKVKKGFIGINGIAKQFFASTFYPNYTMSFTGNAYNHSFPIATHTSNYIIIAGGRTADSDSPNAKVYAYDKNAVEYSAPDLTTQAANGGSMSINGYGIVAGGFTASSWFNRTNQVLAYNDNLSKTTLSTLSSAVYEPSCASNEFHCICMAGTTYNSNVTYAQSYSSDLVKTSISDSSATRRSKCGAGVGEYLVFCGSLSSTGKTDFYNNSNVKTTASNPYNKICWFPLGISTNNYAMFFGGRAAETSGSAFNDIKAYDANSVLTTATMPIAADRLNGFTVRGEYAVVGYNSTAYVYDKNLVLCETISLSSSIGTSNSYQADSTSEFGIIRGNWTTNSALFNF